MIKCDNWPVGICSWSLRTDIAGVAKAMNRLGIGHVHLAVRPALQERGSDYRAFVRKQGWTVSSTMIDFPQEDYSTLESIKLTGGIGPDGHWEQNRQLFLGAVDITIEIGVKYLSMHAGFIDLDQADYAEKFYDRIRHLADAAGRRQIMLLLETGQETATELREFLQELDHPAVGVNFDPGNMILYDKGDPIEALRVLTPWIKHVHVKDAVRTKQAGAWGVAVPWGEGEVGGDAFLKALQRIGFQGTLAVERESGDDRFGDIKLAVERLISFKQPS